MARQTTVVFPTRNPADGRKQPTLPKCRAFRIIPLAPYDVQDQASPACFYGNVPSAPSNALEGTFPVWIIPTNPANDQEERKLLMVDHEGWIPTAMGKDWRIEYVGVIANERNKANTDADGPPQPFCYAVETVDDLDEAGQVNRSPRSPRVETHQVIGARDFATSPLTTTFYRPKGATGVTVFADMGSSSPMTGSLNGYVMYRLAPDLNFISINGLSAPTAFGFSVAQEGYGIIAQIGSAARVVPAGIESATNRVADSTVPPPELSLTFVNTAVKAGSTLRFGVVWEFANG